jgi:DNA-binding MarR family transcriptional regulator
MQSRSSITEELGTLGALLRTMLDALNDQVYARLAEEGFPDIRLAHGVVFRHLSKDGSRIGWLAKRARMTKQSMAELVGHLADTKYVELIPDSTDGRAKLVRLTERGWKVQHALLRLSAEFERSAARGLGTAKWERLRALLQDFAAWTQQSARE